MYSYTLSDKEKEDISLYTFGHLPQSIMDKIEKNYFNHNKNSIDKHYSYVVFNKSYKVIFSETYKKPNILLPTTLEKQSKKIFDLYKDKKIFIVYIKGNFKKLKYLPFEDNFKFYKLISYFSFLIHTSFDITDIMKEDIYDQKYISL